MSSSTGPPVLSTPDMHMFQDHNSRSGSHVNAKTIPRLSDEQLHVTYEIQRTVREIRAGRWKRIALQFPDHMLPDASRVFLALSSRLQNARRLSPKFSSMSSTGGLTLPSTTNAHGLSEDLKNMKLSSQTKDITERLFILADTSYGSCCVDEVAAEHVDADVVVHYGRSCLSRTTRLPVIYVYTKPPLALERLFLAFQNTYQDKKQKIILMADLPYASYVPEITSAIRRAGYLNVYATEVVHDTASQLPNRTVPQDVAEHAELLHEYCLFHISEPPQSLLFTLSSRLSSIHIYSTTSVSTTVSTSSDSISSTAALRRRYALLTSMTTVPIFGILVNTLSVKNYMEILSHVKEIIAAAGKKSYTFVVGKVNAAKVANFAEIGGWVVIGCWESSLFESKDFWKPVITPFELELALQADEERVWTGQWTSDFQTILDEAKLKKTLWQSDSLDQSEDPEELETNRISNADIDAEAGEVDEEEESEPPEFDFRTGQYVSHSRPMGTARPQTSKKANVNGSIIPISHSLIKRANGELATFGNTISPAADFFQNKRTWRGLGSDLHVDYDERSDDGLGENGAVMEQGRNGIARGYVVGETIARH